MITVTTTSGVEFRLLKSRMTSFHMDGEQDRHFAYRKDVKASFAEGKPLPAVVFAPAITFRGWAVVHRRGTSIAIGCMRFSGANYRTLRKWALSTR